MGISKKLKPPGSKRAGFVTRLQLLTHREAIGWPLLAISVIVWPLSLYPLFSQGGGSAIVADLWLNLISMLIGHLAMFGFLFLGKYTWWKSIYSHTRTRLAFLSMVIAVLIGSIATNLTQTMLGSSYSIGAQGYLIRLALMVFIFLAIARVYSFLNRLDELGKTSLGLQQTKIAGQQQLSQEANSVLDRVHKILEILVAMVQMPQVSATQTLTEISQDVLRPMSHKLSQDSSRFSHIKVSSVRPNWTKVFQVLSQKSIILPGVTSVLSWLFIISFSVRNADSATNLTEVASAGDVAVSVNLSSLFLSLAELAIVFLSVLAVGHLLRFIASKLLADLPQRSLLIQGSTLLLLPVLALALMDISFMVLNINSAISFSAVWLLLLAVPIFIFSAGVSVLRIGTAAERSVLIQLEVANEKLATEVSGINQELFSQRENLAQKLHGPLRAQLISTALKLSKEQAKEHFDETTQQEIIANLVAEVRVFEQTLFEKQPSNAIFAIEQLQELWRDTCEINLQISDSASKALQQKPASSDVISSIVTEAASNAISHGGATEVAIVISLAKSVVSVKVADNGKGLEKTSFGLGSKLLDETTLRWSLFREGNYTTLKASVPLGFQSIGT